jgi:hypothetical protein
VARGRLVNGKNTCYKCSVENEAEIQIASRVSKTLYAKLEERQKEAKKLTGIEPSISAVVRAMLEEAAESGRRKR